MAEIFLGVDSCSALVQSEGNDVYDFNFDLWFRGLMQAKNMVFIKKYQKIREPRIIIDMAVEFTPVIAGKSKSKLTP